jgi:hypothetical protein
VIGDDIFVVMERTVGPCRLQCCRMEINLRKTSTLPVGRCPTAVPRRYRSIVGAQVTEGTRRNSVRRGSFTNTS